MVGGIGRLLSRKSGRYPSGRVVAGLAMASVLLTGCTSAGSDLNPTSGKEPAATANAPTIGGSSPSVSSSPGTSTTATGSATTSAGGTTTAGGTPSGPVPLIESVVMLAPGTADEASGIAASNTVPDAYFLVDDGTGTEQLVAVAGDGQVIARIDVDGMSADNAEALASGTCGSTPLPTPDSSAGRECLYIGDIGDNSEQRDSITIYRIAEPDLTSPPSDPVPADEWTYTYPDQPQNAEAMLVDTSGSLLIVTKPSDGKPHHIYRGDPGGGELTFVREFRPPEPAIPMKTLFTGNVVTDAAAAPGRVLLLTYDEVQMFVAPDPAAEIADFPDWPHTRMPLPALPQAEGITAVPNGCGYTVASEAGPAGKAGELGIVRCQ